MVAAFCYATDRKNVGDCEEADTMKKAICVLNSEPGQVAKGVVNFEQENEYAKTHVIGKFVNLSPNQMHGFHIHKLGNLTKGCMTAGPHYNPHGHEHGGPYSAVRHIGDLGNVFADSKGNGTI